MDVPRSRLPDGPRAPGAAIEIRPWREDADFEACAGVLRRATAHDGFVRVRDAARWRSSFRQFSGDPARDCWLASVDGDVAGYAMVFDMGRDDPTIRLLVHNVTVDPACRGRQVEHRLLDIATARLGEIAAASPSGPGTSVRLSAEISDRETYMTDLLTGRGYETTRYTVEMARPLDAAMPHLTLPPGIEVRPVDGSGLALRILAELSVAVAEEGMPAFTETEIAEILAHPVHGQFEHWVVAWAGTEPAAGVLGWIDPAENREQGRARAYTERVMTQPAWRRRGIASTLLVRAMEHFREAGMTEAALTVDTDNVSGALGLYERLGFERVSTWLGIDRVVERIES
jgi:mycothiol synthase